MSTLMADLGIDRLSPQAKADLALEIWDSLGQERPVGRLDDDRAAELQRRDNELEADPSIALTWEQIRARLEGAR